MFNLFKKNLKKGFSLMELIVVIGIVTLITSVVLFNHSVFSGGTILENLAYDVALTIRQAQFYGINVKSFEMGETTSFDVGYGVYFDMENPTSFSLFADVDGNGLYGGAEELVEVYNMTRGNEIMYLYTDNVSVGDLNLTFKRPDPDAVIRTENGGCGVAGCGEAKIYLGSPDERVAYKVVTVTSTGQIAIGTYRIEE